MTPGLFPLITSLVLSTLVVQTQTVEAQDGSDLETTTTILPPTTTTVPPLTTNVPPTTKTTTLPMTTTAIIDCRSSELACLNGGSCVLDITDMYGCECPTGFDGTDCGVEDLCVTRECPPTVQCLEITIWGVKDRVCICPDGFKGLTCEEEDINVVCQNHTQMLYFDLQAPDDQRIFCLRKSNSIPDGVCYDPEDYLNYRLQHTETISFSDSVRALCVHYISNDLPGSTEYCFDIRVFEADDVYYRPWRYVTFRFCYTFNRPPSFIGPLNLTFNLPNIPQTVTTPLEADDMDVHQNLSFSILDVQPRAMAGLFIVDSGKLVINKPTSITTDPTDVTIQIQVQDSGIPTLAAEGIINVVFTDRSLLCESSDAQLLVHFETGQASQVQLGSITCAGVELGSQTGSSFTVTGGPVTVDETGTILFNPNSEVVEGNFDVSVSVEVLLPVRLESFVSFVVIAGFLRPSCSPTGDPIIFSETDSTDHCLDSEIYKCSMPATFVASSCTDVSDMFQLSCNDDPLVLFTTVFICVASDLRNMVGNFRIEGTVANKFGETGILVDGIRVTNVNDAPAFMSTTLSKSISEHTKVGSLIFTVVVSDPDLDLTLPSPETLTVVIESESSVFHASLDDRIVIVTLNQELDIRTQNFYKFNLIVQDSGGLTGSLEVSITVDDINDPPICTEQLLKPSLFLTDDVFSIVASPQCSDPDITPAFNELTFSLTGAAEVLEFVAVDASTGVVSLKQPLRNFPNPVNGMEFIVTVSDGAFSFDVTIQATIQVGYVRVESITQSPDILYNGTELNITCRIVAVGFPDTEEFSYWWNYNDRVIKPTSTSRFTLSSSTLSIPEQKESTLRLKPLRSSDSGKYSCAMAPESGGPFTEDSITIDVISQPVVTLTPSSLTVNEGSNVTLECEVIRPLEGEFQFRWYRNENPLQSIAGEVFTSTGTSVILTISAVTETTKFGCEAENEAGVGPRVTSYIGVIPTEVEPDKPTVCVASPDNRDNTWPVTAVDAIAVRDCPPQTVGSVTRRCKADGEWAMASYKCVRETIRSIQKQINQAQDGSGTANVTTSLGDLADATDTDDLLEGDLTVVINILNSVAAMAKDRVTAPGESETETENFLEVASNLLNIKLKVSWDADIYQGQPGAINVAEAVESIIKAKLKQISSSTNDTFTKRYTHTNIYAEIGRSDESDMSAYTFPNSVVQLPSWVGATTTEIFIPATSFKEIPSREYSSQVYRNMPSIVVTKLQINGQNVDNNSFDINSDVTIAFQPRHQVTNLDPPARITFQHASTNYSKPVCGFWDSDKITWSTDGCELVSTSDTHTVCTCNHFTNFAVLMSPGKTPEAHLLALSIISAVGCGVSLFCLFLTVVAHLRVWRLVKSDRATLLIHLCVALALAYVVFLAGINRAENKDVCTAISALLHYIWLVVFFLMLAEGIDIGVSVLYVFVTKSRVKWLVPLAWGMPVIVVGVSLGITRLEGYGTDTFCWLSTESGLIWAFVGPALFVILVNFIIIIAVFRKMFQSSAMLNTTDKDKAKTSVRSLCVLLPVMGGGWVIGVFSVNEDLVAFQYVFAICNALQGFFIFLFHCWFNIQLRDALKQTRERKKSLASFEKSYKRQTSSVTASTTYYSADGSEKKPSKTEAVSNPFLEADRQMQEMAKKNKKGSANIFNKTPNNKIEMDKNKVVDVALEDVKIANILRESEVMGEAAGISSILNSQERLPEADLGHTRTEEIIDIREDERHFLLECAKYTDIRDKLLGPLVSDTVPDRLIHVMKNDNFRSLANYIIDAYERRCELLSK